MRAMSTPKVTASDTSNESVMRPTVRRGPRYRSPAPRPSVRHRESPTEVVMRAAGLSPAQAHRLRFEWPGQINRAVLALRKAGYIEAAATIIAQIEEAGAGQTITALDVAIQAEQDAESACNNAETRALLDPTPENDRAALRASAIEISHQVERDALRRARLRGDG